MMIYVGYFSAASCIGNVIAAAVHKSLVHWLGAIISGGVAVWILT